MFSTQFHLEALKCQIPTLLGCPRLPCVTVISGSHLPKGLSTSSGGHLDPTALLKEGHMEQVAHDQIAFEYLQVWRLDKLFGRPVAVFSHPHSEKVLLFRGNLLHFSLFPLPLVPSLGTTEKNQFPFLHTLPFRYL